MQATVQQSFLKKFVPALSRLATNSVMPVLSCIDINVKGRNVVLSATNLQTTAQVTIPTDTEDEFAMSVFAKSLSDIVNLANSDTITISPDTGALVFKTTGTKSKINGISHEEFPPSPEIGTKFGRISAYELRMAIQKTMIAVSTDDSRPTLHYILIDASDDDVFFVAADGFRMGVHKTTMQVEKGSTKTVTLHRSTAKALLEFLPENETDIKIYVSRNTIGFEFPDGYVWGQLSDQGFPNWRQVMPREFKHEVILNGKEIDNALNRARIFAGPLLVAKFQPRADGKMAIVGENESSGRGETEVAASLTEQIGMNCVFAQQGIKAIGGGGEIHLRYNSAKTPMLWSNGSDKYRYLLMPMYIHDESAAAAAAVRSEAEQAG